MLNTHGILKVLLQNHQTPREFLVFDLGIYLKNISVFTLAFLNAFLFFLKKTMGFCTFLAKTIKAHWFFLIFQWLTVLFFNRKPLKKKNVFFSTFLLSANGPQRLFERQR